MTDQTNQLNLWLRKKASGITKWSVFRGTDPNVTEEDIAIEMHKTLDRIESGELKSIDNFDRHLVTTNIKEL